MQIYFMQLRITANKHNEASPGSLTEMHKQVLAKLQSAEGPRKIFARMVNTKIYLRK